MGIDARRASLTAAATIGLLVLLGGCSLIGATVSTVSQVALPVAGAKLMFACIPEGTLVDTPSGPIAIEALLAGDPVIGFDGEVVRILQKHAYAEDATATEFLAVEFSGDARVDLCGMHRIDGVRAANLLPGDTVAGRTVTRTTRYRGVRRSYDLLTEDRGYRIQGLPVDSMIEEMYAAGRAGRDPREE